MRPIADNPPRVLHVDDDEECLDLVAAYLNRLGKFRIRSVSTAADALDVLDEETVDCVLSDYEMPSMDGLELLRAIRERRPSLPFILFTNETRDAVAEPLCDASGTAFLRKGAPDATIPLLAKRIRRLVASHRLSTLVRRSVSALETTNDAVAVVAPDGSFAFVNQAYQTRLGYDSESLVGRQWHDCYPDDEVSRIESRALPTVEDGWEWTGRCVARRRDGDRIEAQIRIAGLDDGSLVICHPRTTEDDPRPATDE